MEDQNQIDEGNVKAKQWMQDNLRIIISILIVVAIAGGIYSYSKRTQPSLTDISEETLEGSEQIIGTEGAATEKPDTGKVAGTAATETIEVPQAGTSQETGDSFVESAARGDSLTKLARRALANYLEKNPDSTLTAEHKIYIEDYLRKNVPKQRVFVGTSVEFSKSLIQNAITQSKTLNERQLNNLHKYAVRVPSLS